MTSQLSPLPDPRSQGFGHVQKVPTGIEGFDDICHGGLPTGRATLISGTSGTGKTVFSLHFLYNGIKQFGEPGIFVTFEESPIDILRNASSFGWSLQDLVQQDKLFVLDASPDPEGEDMAGSFDLSGLIERINYAIRKYKAKRVAIDSVTAVFQQYEAVPGGRLEGFRMIARPKEIGGTTGMATERIDEDGPSARHGV
ncbi:MAG TPA: circadian clock protein KaiC, partial [Synechococcus sp. UBA8638]|nr:circadian clock protein KaiC [Synechococcus sp. UBA8638]